MRVRDIFEGNLTVQELKKKKDSLFATYRGYCRKIQASLKSGAGVDDVYCPVWFAFDLIDNFLGSVFKCKQTMPTVSFYYFIKKKTYFFTIYMIHSVHDKNHW